MAELPGKSASRQRVSHCRICQNPIEPFMSFGRMPIANGFLGEDAFDREYFFELAPALCSACGMFQIVEHPAPENMFHANYAYYSSTSADMQTHFRAFADAIVEERLEGHDHPFVVELGSNDGILLRNFAQRGIRHLGIEPSENVAEVARRQGINTLCAFFTDDLAGELANEYGHADAIVAANVICHIPNFHEMASGIATLLSDDGVFVFEEPYVGDMVAKTAYDQIYDEHIFMFSAQALKRGFVVHGLDLIDATPQPTHGGSMRYCFGKEGRHTASPRVGRLLDSERSLGLNEPGTFDRFRHNCELSRDNLVALLEKLRRDGQRVVGYGATSKSTTVLNYCNIDRELIEFISDNTPSKIGKFTPGMHVPVRSHAEFSRDYPEHALLLAWNHRDEIIRNEGAFRAGGGKWITYIPDVEIF